jgi:hypothetical protein
MRGGNHAANHDQGNTQHAEKNSPRQSHGRRCDSAQHPMNIAQFQEKWEVTPPEPAKLHYKMPLELPEMSRFRKLRSFTPD